mmetsp:Transcript_178263/g.571435  ORF Transcript_178263/g.571435 Transcript_178263/m.571435 type:complete len:210 (+) Transcript_178263:1525-2154(+)
MHSMKYASPLAGSVTFAASWGGKLCARTKRSTFSSTHSREMAAGASFAAPARPSSSSFGATSTESSAPSSSAPRSAAFASPCFMRSVAAVSATPTGTREEATSVPALERRAPLNLWPNQIGANSGHGDPASSAPALKTYFSMLSPAAKASGKACSLSGTYTVRSGLKPSTTRAAASSLEARKLKPSSTQRRAKMEQPGPSPLAKPMAST